MKSTRTSRTSAGLRPYAPRSRGAAAAGLVAALALTGLSAAGTAHAEGGPRPSPTQASSAPPSAVPRPSAPSTPSASPTHPGPQPSDATAPPSAPPTSPGTRGDGGPPATPRPAPAKGADSNKELARTGASSTATVALGAGAAALIAVGGGAVYAARRRRD
ncbi:LPXTG cell wall anchor domain-containing protein [Streptomyces angustmyceticus]|uniref:LPXTG cell wall anchor domain-containing protein n=1 Tax=Streptomyces angustmyceticus TaxID=285578 RepID=UPI00147886C1|nr:LPXTG cell wall anchor domain-containing protein [Streptomyces angustmyceticus]UAL67981.1 LPXTG cell wall anchor domain-containing protein [Streptomyces angustmyceticus]